MDCLVEGPRDCWIVGFRKFKSDSKSIVAKKNRRGEIIPNTIQLRKMNIEGNGSNPRVTFSDEIPSEELRAKLVTLLRRKKFAVAECGKKERGNNRRETTAAQSRRN